MTFGASGCRRPNASSCEASLEPRFRAASAVCSRCSARRLPATSRVRSCRLPRNDLQHIVEIVRHAAGQVADRLHLLRLSKLRFGVGPLGDGGGHPGLQLFVGLLQDLFGLLPRRDIDGRRDIAKDVAVRRRKRVAWIRIVVEPPSVKRSFQLLVAGLISSSCALKREVMQRDPFAIAIHPKMLRPGFQRTHRVLGVGRPMQQFCTLPVAPDMRRVASLVNHRSSARFRAPLRILPFALAGPRRPRAGCGPSRDSRSPGRRVRMPRTAWSDNRQRRRPDPRRAPLPRRGPTATITGSSRSPGRRAVRAADRSRRAAASSHR